MLRVDNKDFAQLQEDHPFKKIFGEAMDKVKRMHLPTLSLQEAKRKISYDANGNQQHSNGCYVNCTQRYQVGGVSYLISYYDSITYGENNREILLPRQLDFDGTVLELKNESIDKQFLFLFVDPQCEVIEEFKGYQNEIRRPAEYALVQKAKDAKTKIFQAKKKAELEKMFYDLEEKEEALYEVCFNFGIQTTLGNGQKREKWELMERLMNIVFTKDSKGNYNDDVLRKFESVVKPTNAADFQRKDMLTFLGQIKEAKLVHKFGTASGSWFLEESKENKLCSWRNGQEPDDALFNYFLTRKEEVEAFKDKLKKLQTA